MTRMVVGAGWHDVCVRWDISTPQAVVGRLNALPGQGSMRQPGKKLFAERDRFGTWQHALGPSHVLLAYVVDSPEYGLIRRLELQTHLGEEVENDLCRPSEFPERWERVQTRMRCMVCSRPRIRSMCEWILPSTSCMRIPPTDVTCWRLCGTRAGPTGGTPSFSTREFEQLTGFLDAERLGLTERVHNPETARRRRALARKIGSPRPTRTVNP
jgi:hypothetical protein